MLTVTFSTAAATPGFVDRVAELAPATNAGSTLDLLAVAAAEAFMHNQGLAAFALLHGTTVSAMSRVLLPYLDEPGARQLEAATAAFVAAALIGFDGHDHSTSAGTMPTIAAADRPDRAAATREDHTIKFADACLGVAQRTGASIPLQALDRQIASPYGISAAARPIRLVVPSVAGPAARSRSARAGPRNTRASRSGRGVPREASARVSLTSENFRWHSRLPVANLVSEV
jgi:hypothetical protein